MPAELLPAPIELCQLSQHRRTDFLVFLCLSEVPLLQMDNANFDPDVFKNRLIATNGRELVALLLEQRFQFRSKDEKAFADLLIDFHNQGEISLLSTSFVTAACVLPNQPFWSLSIFLQEILPRLDGKAVDVIRLVDKLVKRGGQDGAADWPIGALRKWFVRNPGQAHEAASLAEQQKSPYRKYGAAALAGTGDLDLIFASMESANTEFASQALWAMSLIEKLRQADARRVVNRCVSVLASSSDRKSRSVAMEVAFRAWKACPGIRGYKQKQLLDLVLAPERVGEAEDETDLLKLAEMVFYYRDGFKEQHESLFLEGLCAAKDFHTQILRVLDSILHVSPRWDFERVASVFEHLLPQLEEPPDREAFDGFTTLIWSGASGENRSYLFARWFSNGHPALCSFLARRISTGGNMDRVIEIRKEHLPVSVADQVRLAARTVGYCFGVPQAAASILLSVVRNGKRSAREEAERLLWNPLAVGYSGTLREYLGLAVKSKSKRVQDCAARLLERQDEYLEGLRRAAELQEHQPSGWQYAQVTRAKYQDLFSRMYKEANKSSIFADLIRNVNMLYGTGCVGFGHQGRIGDGKPQITELDKKFSVSTEFPKQQTIDPIGIELMLYSLRYGGPSVEPGDGA